MESGARLGGIPPGTGGYSLQCVCGQLSESAAASVFKVFTLFMGVATPETVRLRGVLLCLFYG